MAKKLIVENNVKDFIESSAKKIYIDSDTILTPGAKDYLSSNGIKIEYGPKRDILNNELIDCENSPKEDASSIDILIAAAYVLKSEYGITDPFELRNASYEIVDALKKNLNIK